MNDVARLLVFITVHERDAGECSEVVGLAARGWIERGPIEDDATAVAQIQRVNHLGLKLQQVGFVVIKTFCSH
jgi:hypothetical protein